MSSTANTKPPLSTSSEISLRDRLQELNVTSSAEAAALAAQGQRATVTSFVLAPFAAFVGSYFGHQGWRHGLTGLILALFAAYGVFVRATKLWEQQNVKTTVPPPPQS